MPDKWVYLNRSFVSEEKATISIHDRGFLFGEGIFTTIRICDGRVEFLQQHLSRLQEQALFLNMDISPFNLDWIPELIEINQAKKGS